MFPTETYRDLAVIISWTKQQMARCPKVVSAFWPMAKDLIALGAASITAGTSADDWNKDAKVNAILDRLEISGQAFIDVFDAHFDALTLTQHH